MSHVVRQRLRSSARARKSRSGRWRAGLPRRGPFVDGHLFHFAHDEDRAERDGQLVDAPLESSRISARSVVRDRRLRALGSGTLGLRVPVRVSDSCMGSRRRSRAISARRISAWFTAMRVSHVPIAGPRPETRRCAGTVQVRVLQRVLGLRVIARRIARTTRNRLPVVPAHQRSKAAASRCAMRSARARSAAASPDVGMGSIQSDARQARRVPATKETIDYTDSTDSLGFAPAQHPARNRCESVQSVDASVDWAKRTVSVTA